MSPPAWTHAVGPPLRTLAALLLPVAALAAAFHAAEPVSRDASAAPDPAPAGPPAIAGEEGSPASPPTWREASRPQTPPKDPGARSDAADEADAVLRSASGEELAPSGPSGPAAPSPAGSEGITVAPVAGAAVMAAALPWALTLHPLHDDFTSVSPASVFGDARPRGRSHAGIDLPAPKGTPVRAVADGRVRWVHDEQGGRCCALAIEHEGGWRSRYIHLDNDTPGTDDGQRVGIADDIERGTEVRAGELIGWVGDSGNAERTIPHLHFEVRDAAGVPVDPLPFLRALSAGGHASRPDADTSEGRPAGETLH